MLINKVVRNLFVAMLWVPLAVSALAQSDDLVKVTFYKAMSGNDLKLVNEQLVQLDQLGPKAELAYKGAMLMKKAGLLEQPGDKLKTFKEGREMLEKAIEAAPANPEFRFLRIMIQENAPGILGYDSNLGEDADVVAGAFHELSPELKDAVINYSKNSKILNTKG